MEHIHRLAVPELHQLSYSIQICGDYVGILFKYVPLGRDGNEFVVWSWRTGVQKIRVSIACTSVRIDSLGLFVQVLSANVHSFVFLGNNYILASTWAPPALLVYNPKQRAAEDTTHLRFLLGARFQSSRHPFTAILLAPDASPGWLPSTGEVPFQIAGDERRIAMYSEHFDNRDCVSFLIPTKALLRQIESLQITEGLDVEWEAYGQQLLEPLPEHPTWMNLWSYFMFGMRYILPQVEYFGGKHNIVIRDLSPRRFLRASKEEREESQALEKAIKFAKSPYHRVASEPNQHSILTCVPLPESISPWIRMLLITEDGIVIVEEVHDYKTCVCLAARLIRLACRWIMLGAPQSPICSRCDSFQLGDYQLDCE
jgi:hypothetical protein